ncbi:hypothetical protein N7509_004712 [Penicillium cosmopolitanum]|uniref:C2H2-type domain-containing protein n=1 Tax=Penicillium cosmopolitanum TaxID=1131564 RepID=A0A9W9W0U5_9EURO|nr:uncharacterized protein N7509_004712 [Penicillium cosmopolitanum]KAJ5396599.1 hypothetical protein N7509_004712 [Penicillium cosmopolitanum]
MADNNGDTERKPLTHAGFDNPEVLNAVSPHPTFGYFHGPIPNLNLLQGIPSENAATNAISYVDPTHSVICDVVGENGEMCGKIYPRPSALRKHLRKKHPGSGVGSFVLNTPRVSLKKRYVYSIASCADSWDLLAPSCLVMPPVLGEISPLQIHTAECALKKRVLLGGCRNAVYLNEPRRGYGLITEYCDALEWIA